MITEVKSKDPESSRARKRGSNVNIGFDYGTFSTKVVTRWRGEAQGKVILFDDEPTPKYPAFATPSAVRVREGHIYFGRHAVQVQGGDYFQSLKVQLLPSDPELGQKPIEFSTGLSPELLIACYLSWALSEIRQELGEVQPGGVSLNLAAPMNHIEDPNLKRRYLGIIQASWESVFGEKPIEISQGSRLSSLQTYFEPWLSREVPDRKFRKYDVMPETIAPIVSLSNDPKMQPGMYLMVDMGAGTTECSINYVTGSGADRRINCYLDRSVRIGGDDLQQLAPHIDRLLKRFLLTFNETWFKGSEKDRTQFAKEKWRKVIVFLTGGGARHPDIQKIIRKSLPKAPYHVAEESYTRQWHVPSKLDLGELPEQPIKDDLPLLSVADGLSYERQIWPKNNKPGEIKRIDIQFAPEPPMLFAHLEN